MELRSRRAYFHLNRWDSRAEKATLKQAILAAVYVPLCRNTRCCGSKRAKTYGKNWLKPLATLLMPPPTLELVPLAVLKRPPLTLDSGPLALLEAPPPTLDWMLLAVLFAPPLTLESGPLAVLFEPPLTLAKRPLHQRPAGLPQNQNRRE